jgi:HemY protein
VLLHAESVNGDALPRIERAEGWLQAQPRDAPLLLTLGRLCARQGLWGKAQSYLEASIAIEPTWSAQLALAQLHEKLGNAEAAHRHARESLDLAVERLRQATGGQHQMPL